MALFDDEDAEGVIDHHDCMDVEGGNVPGPQEEPARKAQEPANDSIEEWDDDDEHTQAKAKVSTSLLSS